MVDLCLNIEEYDYLTVISFWSSSWNDHQHDSPSWMMEAKETLSYWRKLYRKHHLHLRMNIKDLQSM